MFERFTDRARHVLVAAQEEARLLDHNYIGTEHVLLGLLHEREGLAVRVLEGLGVTLEEARLRTTEITKARRLGEAARPGKRTVRGNPPFTPLAKKVLELSLREALALGHKYIATEHILLGLLRTGEGVGYEVVLSESGASPEQIRQEVLDEIKPSPRWGPIAGQGRSAALLGAIRKAGELAAGEEATTGHMLTAVLQDPRCQAALALGRLGVTEERVRQALEDTPLASTDESPKPLSVIVGRTLLTIEEAGLAEALRSASPEQIKKALEVLGQPPAGEQPGGDQAAGTG